MQWAANGRWFDGAILAALLAASLSLQTLVSAPGADGDSRRPVAVVFAPWVDSGEAMRRVGEAGARVVRFGAFPFIVVAAPERPEFSGSVTASGALLILDPKSIAACLTLRGA